jgi:hypothetical protein
LNKTFDEVVVEELIHVATNEIVFGMVDDQVGAIVSIKGSIHVAINGSNLLTI